MFHVNMLREFYPDSNQQVVGWAEDMVTDLQEEIPLCKEGDTVTLDSCYTGEQLTAEQRAELCTLPREFSRVSCVTCQGSPVWPSIALKLHGDAPVGCSRSPECHLD